MTQVNNATDVLAIIGGCCALLMVLGSFFLFYKGILTFQQASPEEAIKVEFQKALSVQTRYPAIALFLLGVIFLGVSLWFEKSSKRVVFVSRRNPERGQRSCHSRVFTTIVC